VTIDIVVLQPDREAPPGILGDRSVARGASVVVHELWHRATLPTTVTFCAGLVVLGGTGSALDDDGPL